jgi:ankyrin repeat protein
MFRLLFCASMLSLSLYSMEQDFGSTKHTACKEIVAMPEHYYESTIGARSACENKDEAIQKFLNVPYDNIHIIVCKSHEMGCNWLEILSRHGIDIVKSDHDGNTLLHKQDIIIPDPVYAMFKSYQHIQREIIQFLVGYPMMDINHVNKHGFTPLHIAARLGNRCMVQELLKHPHINVHMRTTFGENALHIASRFGNTTIVKILLEYANINVHAVSSLGETALDIAIYHEHSAIVALLREHSLFDA